MDDIIIKLQESIAHHDDDISRMSDELYAQQQELSTLRKQLSELKNIIIASEDSSSEIRDLDEEAPPPHY